MADRSGPGRGRTELAGPFALALLLGACVDGNVVDLDPDGSLATRCFSSILYLVQGDLFTMLSTRRQTIDPKRQSSNAKPSGSGVAPPGGGNPLEPRAKMQVQLGGYGAEVRLFWDDAVVESVELSQAFLQSGEVAILGHDAEDGTRVEAHVYASRSCEPLTQVATRAEIEALEGKAPSSDAGVAQQ